MANPFRAREVPGPLKSEIKARGKDTQLIEWAGTRFPWVYVLSCAGSACKESYNEMGNDPDTNGKVLSLFGNNTSLAGLNKETTLPLPYVDGLSVKAMGSLGTTRKATIDIKCYTDTDLIELQKCFFVPGMDVRVQYGWSHSCDGSTPPEVLKDPTIPTNKAICKINKMRKEYSSYDGFQGIVSSFKYNLSKSNVWECSLEVISAADPFTDSTVSNDQCPCPREVETDQGESIQSNGPIYAALADIYNDGAGEARRVIRKLNANLGADGNRKFASWEMEGVERTETGGEKDGSWYDGIFGGEETEEFFITFGTFIDMLNSYSIPHDPSDATNKFPFGRVDVNNVVLPKPSFVATSDVRVCYIQGFSDQDVNDIFNERESGTGSVNAKGTDSSTGKTGVLLSQIMCNVIMLNKHYKSCYDGDKKLKTLIDNVLGDINRVCGGPWNFVTVSTEEDCERSSNGPTITILDQKQQMTQLTPFELPTTPDSSVLTDFGLNLKMAGSMKTQALYANNGQSGGGKADGKCQGIAIAPFYLGGGIKNQAKPEPKTTEVNCGGCEESPNKTEEPTWEDLLDEQRDGEINDQTCAALLQYIRKQLAANDPASCAGVPLPFDLNFSLDGISGFEFGQLVTSTRVPKEVRDQFRWQVTKVEHEVKGNEWKTTVSTVARANPFGTAPKVDRTQISG